MKTITFGGGGWLFPFYAGVCQYLMDNSLIDNYRYGAVSVSSFVVCCMLNGISTKKVYNEIMDQEYKKYSRNPLKLSRVYRNVIERTPLKKDFWKNCDKLVVGISSIFLRGKRVSKFKNEIHAKNVLMASSSVFMPRRVGLGLYIDGVFSYNWRNPIKFEDEEIIHVTVKKFQKNNLISPSIPTPFGWCLFPPDRNKMDKLYEDGYNQAKIYFEGIKDISQDDN